MSTVELASSPGGTPEPLPHEYHELIGRLEEAGHRYRASQVLKGLARFVVLVGVVGLGAVWVAGHYVLPTWGNVLLLVLLADAVVTGYAVFLHRAMFRRASYAEIARVVEEGGGGLDNALINSVLLAQELESGVGAQGGGARAWIPHMLREASVATEGAAFEKAIPWRRTGKAWTVAAVCGVAGIIWISLAHATFFHGVAVLMSPRQFVPRAGSVHILEVSPGNDTALVGATINFSVRIERRETSSKPPEAKLTLEFAGGKSASYPMTAFGAEGDQFVRTGVVAAESMHYVITVDDTQSERFRITVLPQIHLTDFSLVAVPPAYTGRGKQTVQLGAKDLAGSGGGAKGSADVPLGSMATVQVSLDGPAKEVLLDIAGGTPQTLIPAADGKSFSTKLRIDKSLQYTVRINDGENRTIKQFPEAEGEFFLIRAVPDAPPTVMTSEPGHDTDAKPGDKVPLQAQAADDYGITQMRLEIAKNQEKEFHAVQTWPVNADKQGKAATSATIRHMLDLPAADYNIGDTLRYRFVTTDNRDLRNIDAAAGGGGPQTGTGQIFTISFNDTSATASRSTKLWEDMRARLTAILERQIPLRKQANDFSAGMDAEKMCVVATPIEEGQKGIKTDIAALVKDFPFEPSMKLVQKSLQVLAVEDAAFAVERGADILLLTDSKGLPPLAIKLRQHQNRIIDVLQTLLAIAAADQERIAREADHDGGDLPPNARDAWKKLDEQLKDFEKEQKAVIDATADLAKKPKAEFDDADKKKLDELTAMEDKWEHYLNEKLADLSRLAEQDQANAALLEELVQMKVELATAKDALEQKAVEIATPLEENGLESAKELTTHIERWLQQQPDRTAWQMEDPTTQNDQHMAELPKQLQDMVGDLMDKEEDLTQQMESQASKWVDSLDKGTGWDAMDGPISDMSAQGVTGNQMPKDMEIQGRSGEGREGRASGEMVGNEAEGKEGRRTPTRLTPEPFGDGQVTDKSQLPEGGATGGGKKGGVGGEGLEGPTPAQDSNISQRLAGQQSTIRNDAERLALQMHAAGYDNFKLIEANAYLKKSEDALKTNQYHTALYYQDQAVQSLNTVKVLAAGQVHVVADSSPTASEKKQKEMESALNGPMPKGYADPVKAYFEKLAGEKQ